MTKMETKDIVALFMGVAIQPTILQLYYLINPKARETSPLEPAQKIMGQLLLATIMGLGSMRIIAPADLFYAGIGSYALADAINEGVKLVYSPVTYVPPRTYVPPPVIAQGRYVIV